MERQDLDELREPRAYPAVSLLVPLQRERPGNPEDPIRIRHLVERARTRLRDELGPQGSAPIVSRLEDAVARIDLAHPTDGAAVFVAPDEARVLPLGFAVPERLEIDHTFATRDLLRGLVRTLRYRLLALGEKPTRLLQGTAGALVEVVDGGFPMFVEGARGEPLASGGVAVHTARGEARLGAFLRRVDRALAEVVGDDPLPLVVAGTTRDLAAFDEVTTHRAGIVGRLTGNHEDTRPADLARLAGPIVEAHGARQRAAIVAELREGLGTGRTVVGIRSVGEATLTGRARTVVVEDDFSYPARIVEGHLEPAGDADAPGVLDDAVDGLLAEALDLADDVVITDPGELAELGPIAALLRY